MNPLFIIACILILAGAIALIVRSDSRERLIAGGALGAGALAMLIAAISIIPTGYVGIMRVFGVVQKETLPAGFNLVPPWVKVTTRGIRGYQIQQTGKNAMEVITAKGTRFSVDVAIPLRLERLAAAEIESKIVNGAWRYEAQSISRKTFREEMARFTSFEDFQNRRAGLPPHDKEPPIGIWLGQKIEDNIKSLFSKTYGITIKTPVHVGEVQIRDVNPPAAITQAAAELEAVKIEQQTERDKLKVEEIRVRRRAQEGAGYSNLFAALPDNVDTDAAARFLRAAAEKTRADADAYFKRGTTDAVAQGIASGKLNPTLFLSGGDKSVQPIIPLARPNTQ